MLPISPCFWSPWSCSLKQTPSVPVSGLLPLLCYTEFLYLPSAWLNFTPAFFAGPQAHPGLLMGCFLLPVLLMASLSASPGPSFGFQPRDPGILLCLSLPRAAPTCSTRGTPLLFSLHKQNRFGSSSSALQNSSCSSSFVLWPCRTDFSILSIRALYCFPVRVLSCTWLH